MVDNNIIQVICQISFPARLSISNSNDNNLIELQKKLIEKGYVEYRQIDQFQNEININNAGEIPQIKQSIIINHQFSDLNKMKSVNLTSTYISISTQNYVDWMSFRSEVCSIVKDFITIFDLVIVNRIGLRYVNALLNKAYNITDNKQWSAVVNNNILGVLSVKENIISYNLSAEIKIDEKSMVRLITVLGKLQPQNEDALIIDIDSIDNKVYDKFSLEIFDDVVGKLHTESENLYFWSINSNE